jgi:hypothetical protein
MERRKEQHVDEAEASRRAAQTPHMEEQVGHKSDDVEGFRAREQVFLRQKVRLKNGVEMELGAAEDLYYFLEGLQRDMPRAFATLVALVKPKAAARLPEKVSPQALANLKKHVVLQPGDVPSERMAVVLDASYTEQDGLSVLRNPVIYPGFQFAAEREALEQESNYWAARSPRVLRDICGEDTGEKDQGPPRR